MANSLLAKSKALNEANKNLPSIDFAKFGNIEENEQSNEDKVVILDIDEVEDFTVLGKKQPFKCSTDKVIQIAKSIQQEGQLTPVSVRRKEDGTLEIFSGMTRKKAIQHIGGSTIKAIIFDNVPDDIAFKKLGYANVQRDRITPSEIANLCNMSDNFKEIGKEYFTREEIANMTGFSRKHINRCLNVNKLYPTLQHSVDDDIISVTAVEDILANLNQDEQRELADYIDYYITTPASKKAIKTGDDIKYSKLTVSKLQKVYELAEFVRNNPSPNYLDIDFNIDGIKLVLSSKNPLDDKNEKEENEEDTSDKNVSRDTSSRESNFFAKLKEKYIELRMYDDDGLETYLTELVENAINGEEEILDLTNEMEFGRI